MKTMYKHINSYNTVFNQNTTLIISTRPRGIVFQDNNWSVIVITVNFNDCFIHVMLIGNVFLYFSLFFPSFFLLVCLSARYVSFPAGRRSIRWGDELPDRSEALLLTQSLYHWSGKYTYSQIILAFTF